jgi:hypothetical protein
MLNFLQLVARSHVLLAKGLVDLEIISQTIVALASYVKSYFEYQK